MLYSLFYIENNRYVIAIKQISEIIPFVTLKTVTALPNYAAGLLDHHGESVPVIDLCYLLSGKFSRRKLSTRIILVNITGANNSKRVLGLLVERATETYTVDSDKFIAPGIHNPDMPYVGPVVSDEFGIVTKVLPQDIFDSIDKKLFYPDRFSAIDNI